MHSALFPVILAYGKFELTNQDSAGGKKLVSSRQYKLTGKALKSGNIGDGVKYSRKGIYNFQNHITLQKVKNMKHFVSPTSNLTPKLVVPLASPGRIILVLF